MNELGDQAFAALPYESSAGAGSEGAFQMAYIGLRLLAIYFIVQISQLSHVFFFFEYSNDQFILKQYPLAQIAAFSAPPVLECLVGIMLFRFARLLALRWFSTGGIASGPISSNDVMRIVLSATGLLLLCNAFPYASQIVTSLAGKYINGDSFDRVYLVGSAFGAVVDAVIGILLIVFNVKLARRWHQLN